MRLQSCERLPEGCDTTTKNGKGNVPQSQTTVNDCAADSNQKSLHCLPLRIFFGSIGKSGSKSSFLEKRPRSVMGDLFHVFFFNSCRDWLIRLSLCLSVRTRKRESQPLARGFHMIDSREPFFLLLWRRNGAWETDTLCDWLLTPSSGTQTTRHTAPPTKEVHSTFLVRRQQYSDSRRSQSGVAV